MLKNMLAMKPAQTKTGIITIIPVFLMLLIFKLFP